MTDLADMLSTIAEIQRKEHLRKTEERARYAQQAERNRLLMQEHMPECWKLIQGLKAEGMFGKLVSFTVEGKT